MKLPKEIIKLFERDSEGLVYGEVFITCLIRDGHPRYEVGRKQSFYPESEKESGLREVKK
jgi:hypothetical protein